MSGSCRDSSLRRLAWGVVSMALSSACGSTLLLTKLSFSERDLPRLARGGVALGCHTHDSQVFPLFLVCPGKHQSIGVAPSDGKLSISCPDLGPRPCRKLFERVRSTSWKTSSKSASASAAPGGTEREN
jgi:hypothetical protein